MEFQKWYEATVTSVRQETITPTGYRWYEVWFKNRKMYYRCHQKSSMIMRPGIRVRFTAHQEHGEYWVIDDVLDVRELYHQEEMKRKILG